jgi:hypothetical protein
MPDVSLAPDHASELTELLEFPNAWLTSDLGIDAGRVC